MVKIVPKVSASPQQKTNPRILYLGQNADEICDLVSPHIGTICIDYVEDVSAALAFVRQQQTDIIIVDQRDESLASKLILPLFSTLDYAVKLVVVSTLSDVGSYLKVPGVARVLTAPVRASQLARTLGLDANKIRHDKIKLAEEDIKQETIAKAPRKSLLVYVSNFGMQLVSTAYKRLAFVMLGVLFVSFTFYGFMIGFFLTSSGWAAPQTLTAGNALVDKVQKEIGDARLALNLINQRISETDQQLEDATRVKTEAAILVNYATDTVAKEIVSRARQLTMINQNIARTQRTKLTFEKQLKSGGLSDELTGLYKKHLIDRKAYTSNTLGLLETGQRLAGLETTLESLANDKAQLQTQVFMLHSLKAQLQQAGPMSSITAASADLLLLTKQALDARAAFDTAKEQIEVSIKTKETMQNSKYVLENQIVNFESSTLGRAASQRVDVLFVPYANAAQFKEGANLYTCKFTMVYCWKAGTVGQVLPGEINSVHPFFGKPIRGFFVEANLTDTQAATHEIIHAQRPPFFF
jgi:hypothetical protein